MKKSVVFSVLGLLATVGASAQEVGRVLSATPVVQQVAVPRQVCHQQQVEQPRTGSGAGAIMGALAGGAMGNAIGDGSGRAAATMIGLVGGALLGNRIEGGGSQVQNVPQCSTQTYYENRTVGYNVTYEYGGRQYTVQMPHDPGPTIRLQVTPIGASQEAPAEYAAQDQRAPAIALQYAPQPQYIQQPQYLAPTVITQSYVTVPGPVVYPATYYRPYYPPVGVSLNFGYSRGHRHGHRHWR